MPVSAERNGGHYSGLHSGRNGSRAKKPVHSLQKFFRCTLGSRSLLAVVDVDAHLGPRFDELGFAVAGQLVGSTSRLFGNASKDAA